MFAVEYTQTSLISVQEQRELIFFASFFKRLLHSTDWVALKEPVATEAKGGNCFPLCDEHTSASVSGGKKIQTYFLLHFTITAKQRTNKTLCLCPAPLFFLSSSVRRFITCPSSTPPRALRRQVAAQSLHLVSKRHPNLRVTSANKYVANSSHTKA